MQHTLLMISSEAPVDETAVEPARTPIRKLGASACPCRYRKLVIRAVGQDDARRRLPARDPIGHDQLYQTARRRLCLVKRRR
jgi:hypothetical protein